MEIGDRAEVLDREMWRNWLYETFAEASPHLCDSDGDWLASVKNEPLLAMFVNTPNLVRFVLDAINGSGVWPEHDGVFISEHAMQKIAEVIRDMGFGEDLEVKK